MSCILQRHHNLALNRIISFFLKLSQNLLILSYYIASILPVAVGGLVVSTDRRDSLRVIAGWSGVRISSRARELLFLPPYHHQTCRGVACGLTKWGPAIIAQRCSCLSQATGLI